MKDNYFKYLLGVIFMCVAFTASAADYTGSEPKSGNSYYIYNVGTGLFLGEGDNYGTHASVNATGTELKLVASDTSFNVRTMFGSNYMSKADNGIWMDQSTATKWEFTLVEGTTNQYTIGLGTTAGYLQCTEGQTKVKTAAMPATADYARWILVPKTELDNIFASATYSQPVDATYILANSRFDVSYNGTNPWKGDYVIGGYRADVTGINGGNYVAYQQGKDFDAYAEVTKKGGIYRVVAQGCHYSKDGATALDAHIYFADNYVTLPVAETGTLSTNAKAIANGDYVAEEVWGSIMSTKFKVGFRNEVLNAGDLTMVDNIRIYYYGNALEDFQAYLVDLQKWSNDVLAKPVDTKLATALQDQLALYAETDTTSKTRCGTLAKNVAKAYYAAKHSAQVFDALQAEITAVEALLAEASGEGIAELDAAAVAAKAVYAAETKTNDAARQAVKDLQKAVLDYRFANATGSAPKVTTDQRFARGATMAFGRMTVTGVATNNILEQGFCYATHDNPTYTDNRTTEYISQAGKIYRLRNLTPGTIYYMRAYALTKTYAIGYGDVIKVVTVPKGNVSYYMNTGWPDAATETRVTNACNQAKQLWNDLTSISGYNSSVNYGSGTPTADCSYGGWMRIGPNSAYQKTGTVLHEWLHGVGVGTHWVWYGTSPLRANGNRGNWLGERANAALRFWNNDNSAVLNGDGTHMWPYGVNGAQEDTGVESLYIGLSLIIQGLCEDGLPPTGGFCLPAYTLPVDNDDTKYYIKSESTAHGLYNSYLFVNSDGSLSWKAATPQTVNDSCAWTVSFTPKTAFYQFKNVATGRYITYANSEFTTAVRTAPTSADNLHLMRGRVDVADVDGLRGYWIIHNAKNNYPPTMTATANGGVANTNFDLSNDAVTQRWIISTIEESAEMDKGFVKLAMEDLDKMIAITEALVATPHTENEEGLDARITAELAAVEVDKAACDTPADVLHLTQRVKNAALTFIGLATPTDETQPFDLTFLLANPGMDGAAGWTYNACPDATTNYSCGEFYQVAFDMTQTITDLPRGTYKFCAQAFQRPGTTADSYTKYTEGNPGVTAYLYAGAEKQYIQQICDGQSSVKLGGTESSVGSNYVPNNMEAASKYLAKGLYENEVTTELTAEKNSLKVGLKCVNSSSSYWSIFDNFRLYSLGGKAASEETAIDEVTSTADIVRTEYFRMDGAALNAPQQGVNILRITYSDGKVVVKKVLRK